MRTSLLLLIMMAFFASSAQAKDIAPEPDGIQAAGFVIHPGAEVGIAGAFYKYDSGELKDGLADIAVFLKTRRQEEERHAWNNELSVGWRQFWGVGDAKASGGIDVRLLSDADLFKLNFFRIAPSVSYTYSAEPEDHNQRQDFINHNIAAGASMYLQPGGGAVFSERIGYHFGGHFYQDRDEVSNYQHRIESMTRWNFLPDTSMSLLVDFRITGFLKDERGTNIDGASGVSKNNSSMPIRIKYSLQGLLLARLSYSLGLGYAFVKYTDALKEHMFAMNAGLTYRFANSSSISLEYKKDFENVIYGDYYKLHRVTLGYNGLWFNHLQTKLEVGYGNFQFRSENTPNRTDNLLTVSANIRYHFFPGLWLGLDYKLRYNMSDLQGAGYSKNFIALNVGYEY